MPRRPSKFFSACPPYMGGKRKLVKWIFSHLPRSGYEPGAGDGLHFTDAFLGGGSVSLYAKALGFIVHANDLAPRCSCFGRAVIANSTTRLSDAHLAQILSSEPHPVIGELDGVLTSQHNDFLCRIVTAFTKSFGTKADLLRCLVVRYLMHLRPLGNFGAKTIIEQVEHREWDAMSVAMFQLRGSLLEDPVCVARYLCGRINSGIFFNGQCGHTAHEMDAVQFVRETEGDILYLDPPYAGTSGYERSYDRIDRILLAEPMPESRFTDSIEALNELMDASRGHRVVALSYGNEKIGLDELVKLMGKHRKQVSGYSRKYSRLAPTAGGATSSRQEELLVIAT